MTKIVSLTVENIKGISSKTFPLDLIPNKPSILVAPNGFGKSSIACALKSLNQRRIDLDDKNCHTGDTTLAPRISMTVQNNGATQVLEATATTNEISGEFDIQVINSPIYAKPSGRYSQAGSGMIRATASIEVEAVTLIDTVPPRFDFAYSPSAAKAEFGQNGKILPNLTSLLGNLNFLAAFDLTTDLAQFNLVRKYQTPLNLAIAAVNGLVGTATTVKASVEAEHLANFEAIEQLNSLAELIQKFEGVEKIDAVLMAIQFVEVTRKPDFKKCIKFKLYQRDKATFDELLSAFNSTRHEIKCREVGPKNSKRLEVEFPKGDEVSNGQRDILSFITQLQRAERKFRKTRCILLIDEIFDYLDDGNLIAFQYYIINMIETFKSQCREIYPIILTHLDPIHFWHISFGKKHQLRIRYLARDQSAPASKTLNIVKLRENPTYKSDLERYFFHFEPNSLDLKAAFAGLNPPMSCGISSDFYTFVFGEVAKYLAPLPQAFDPIAVMFGVRIKVEELAYNRILTAAEKQAFVDTHGTANKLDYCEGIGVSVPEYHYLLGILYNESLHWKEGKDFETPLKSKLSNATIRKLVAQVFNEQPQ